MLETSLRHIILTGSQLARLDKTINRFSKLASLDLSRNSISSIDGLLELPMLQRLDISHNNCKCRSHDICCILSLVVLAVVVGMVY